MRRSTLTMESPGGNCSRPADRSSTKSRGNPRARVAADKEIIGYREGKRVAARIADKAPNVNGVA